MDRQIGQIVDQIESLTPGQRRALIRHIKAMGLLESDTLLSDRNALQTAPAVRTKLPPEPPGAQKRTAGAPAAPPRPAARPKMSDLFARPEGSGSAQEPHAETGPTDNRPALGGDLSDLPIHIVFDGGSKGNPGLGYGSYALDWPGDERKIVKLSFGDSVTNNEAEYDTLIASLEAAASRFEELGVDPGQAALEVWGDSQLVCNQVRGDWRCKEPRLQTRLARVRELIALFGKVTLNYHRRENSVKILGH